MPDTHIRAVAITALLGAAGAMLAYIASIPAPFLTGPTLSITLGGLAGLRLAVPARLRDLCFVLVGMSMGASVTPQVLEAAAAWPLSFLSVIVTVVLLLYVAYWILRHAFGYDRNTAMLAASPGHMSYVLSLSADTRSDLASVSIIQSVRVLALTLAVPLIVDVMDLTGAPALARVVMGLPEVGAVLVLSALLGVVFLRWRFPAAFLLGGALVSILAHIGGLATGGVPDWLIIPAYVTLGCMIGTRFSGISIFALRKAFVAGMVLTVVVTVIAAFIAIGVSGITGMPVADVLIAFSPGGLETMAAMAVMMHADATYVGAHHLLRLLFLSVLMPLVLGKASARQI